MLITTPWRADPGTALVGSLLLHGLVVLGLALGIRPPGFPSLEKPSLPRPMEITWSGSEDPRPMPVPARQQASAPSPSRTSSSTSTPSPPPITTRNSQPQESPDPSSTSMPNASPASSPPGHAQVETPPPAPVAVTAGLDEYGRTLSALLSKQQTYPRLAALHGWQGEVRISLRVARKGSLLGAEVIQSSGHEILDRQALQLVQTTPLPLPPQGDGNEFRIVIPIHFRLGAAVSG